MEKPVLSKAVSELVQIKARALAIECGFRDPIKLGDLEVVTYPKTGYGIHVRITGVVGKDERMATARFTPEGESRYWTVEGAKAV